MPTFKKKFKQNRDLRGAGEGTRTLDNLLGRQGLYQLSYSREIEAKSGGKTPIWCKKW